MAEEKQENKKRGVVRQVLKWIGLALLAILLVLGLVFQAPWKIITLLAIIFLACTILPKRLRKWFWVSAAAVTVVLIIWVFLPDDEGWQPYTFNEELAALESKYAIPPEENAALIYNQLLANYNAYVRRPDAADDKLPMRQPWSSKEHPELAEWLQEQQDKIAKLLEASKTDKCRFPIKANIVTNEQWAVRSQAIRRWAFLLISAANNDIAEGRTKQAVEKYIATVQMGKHQCQQPIINDMLVGIAIEALAIGQLRRFIVEGDATEERLRLIENALSEIKLDWTTEFSKVLECERLSAKYRLGNYYQVNANGKIRISRDPWAKTRAYWRKLLESNKYGNQKINSNMQSFAYPGFWHKKLIKAKTVLHWFCLPSSPQNSAKILERIYQNYNQMLESDFDWTKDPRDVPITQFNLGLHRYGIFEQLAGLSKKSLYRLHTLLIRAERGRIAAQLLIALRRYKNKNGNWPGNLDGVKSFAPEEIFIDPTNGSEFVYKISDEEFIFYSKGENNIDEKGQYKGQYKNGADDWIIWPPRSHTSQEKQEDGE